MDFEIKLIEFLQAGRTPFFDMSFQVFSIIGSTLGAVALVLFFIFFGRKHLFWYLLSYGFVFFFVNLLKELVARPRPFNVAQTILDLGDNVTGYSFPSGHAACATAIAIFLGAFLFEKFTKKSTRTYIIISLCIYVFLVCLSRMYLGKHYLTDVICGVVIAGVICSLGLVLRHFTRKKRSVFDENKNGSAQS